MTNNRQNPKKIVMTAVFSALVFVFTFTFKIPIGPAGYVHLGDAVIIISLLFLGGINASIAAAIGAALADFLGGYAVWSLPTFVIKFMFAFICYIIAKNVFNGKTIGYLVGALVAGVAHIAAYTAVKVVLADVGYAWSTLPFELFQTGFGIAAAMIFIVVVKKTGINRLVDKE